MTKMGTINKIKHYWNRTRLMLNNDYFTEYLRKQGVKIGEHSTVLYPSYVDGRLPYLVEIGNNVIVSLNVTILTHDASTAYAGDQVKVGRVIIHDHCFIGANSTILCNVKIGPDSIVGAGSVVSRDIPPNTVYAGNPARFVCKTPEFIEKHRQLGKRVDFLESKHFEHAYVSENNKNSLRASLKNTHGYFCASLPKDTKGN